jgi:SAM-dependent methyltransferase
MPSCAKPALSLVATGVVNPKSNVDSSDWPGQQVTIVNGFGLKCLIQRLLHGHQLSLVFRPNLLSIKMSNIQIPSIDQYKKIYSESGYDQDKWVKRCVPFADSMPALCYAYGITWEELKHRFPVVFSPEHFYNSIKGNDWPDFNKFLKQDFHSTYPEKVVKEITDTSRWNLFDELTNESLWIGKTNRHNYLVQEQMLFLSKSKKRHPSSVLEIGGGAGYVSNTIAELGVNCVSVDINPNHKKLSDQTANYFFNKPFSEVTVKNDCISIEIKKLNLKDFDTIVLVESIEHIPEKRFDIVWDEICKNFCGRLIVTNWLDYHPIPAVGVKHCRRVDDEFYDLLSSHATSCWHRDRSHLVLDFK